MGPRRRVDPALVGRPHPRGRQLRALSAAGAPDVLVVGAGVVGLSAALAMSDRGARVVVAEAAAPGGAQSAGPGRIFRHIHDLPELVRLAVTARAGWLAAEERFGRRFLDPRGTLMLGGPCDAYAQSLRAAGVAHELLGPGDLPSGLAPVAPGLLDPGGGTIDAEAYLAALAAELGPAVRAMRVGDVAAARAERVLVCAGAATPALMAPLGVAIPATRSDHRRVAAARAPHPGLPCLLDRSGVAGASAYVTVLPEGGVALGTHAADDLPEEDAVAVTRAHLAALLPGIDATPAGIVRCDSTVLAGHTEAFGLYEAGRVAAFAGGNLFKHAPALGPLLADAVLDGRVDPLLAPPEAPGG